MRKVLCTVTRVTLTLQLALMVVSRICSASPYPHSQPKSLSNNTEASRALATKLVERLDTLDPFERQRLFSLGDDAVVVLLSEVKKRLLRYYATKNDDDFARFDDCSLDLDQVMEPKFTRQVLDLVRIANLHHDKDARELFLLTLESKGDPIIMLPLSINILKTEQHYWGSTGTDASIALEIVLKSKSPIALDYLIEAIGDPKADSVIREAAYTSVARSGDPKAIAAVLANSDQQRTAESLSEVLGLGDLSVTHSGLLATARDANGQLWGLLQSGIAGSMDLWIIRYDGRQWTDPVFTNLTAQKLGKPQNFINYVNDPDFTRDSDGDGWTDLLEQRLGTDPNNNDTDGDGLIDSKDKNPLSGRPPTSETELVMAAAFQAHFWSKNTRPFPCLVTFPKGTTPFELCGCNWLIVGVEDGKKNPLSDLFNRGTAFVKFGPPMKDFNGNEYTAKVSTDVVLFNAAHTKARVSISDAIGSLSGGVDDLELQKFGDNWIVISQETDFVS